MMGVQCKSPSAFLSFSFLLFVFFTFPSQQISVGQTLISSGQIFELGFFIPGNSGKQYVGIWYLHKPIPVRKVVWVLNRENPFSSTDSASSLTIGTDGNLRLLDGMRNTVWSANVSVQSNNSIAVLSDKGDFALKDNISGLTLWESITYQGDTFFLEDPSPGNFVTGFSLDTPPQDFTWNGSRPYWRSGPWDGSKFIGIRHTDQGYANGFNLLPDKQQGIEYLTMDIYNTSYVKIMFLTPAGNLKIMHWEENVKNWFLCWVEPENSCDVYEVCGPFGLCNYDRSPICQCLDGFVPKATEEWMEGNWTGECVRKTELLCQKNISSLASGKAKMDGFRKLSEMKLPAHYNYLYNEDSSGCPQWCLSNCSCVAYAYVTGIGCMVWSGGLMDVQQFPYAGSYLFLHLAYSDLEKDKKYEKFIIVFATISGLSCWVPSCMVCTGGEQIKERKKRMKHFDVVDRKDTLQDHVIHGEPSELPMIDFDKIKVATNNFSRTNKLGEGGFGPVYKGKLEDGQEVAVKRLSRHSGQGAEEFKNEIRDETKRVWLDLAKRFHIVQGIARWLLYLHRDSCLRVIHRDLKTSNILLDDDMNPNFFDFGLARTFRVTQELANTHRVVGTLSMTVLEGLRVDSWCSGDSIAWTSKKGIVCWLKDLKKKQENQVQLLKRKQKSDEAAKQLKEEIQFIKAQKGSTATKDKTRGRTILTLESLSREGNAVGTFVCYNVSLWRCAGLCWVWF
ncbi:unnamed protein product [Camellia sinensis]